MNNFIGKLVLGAFFAAASVASASNYRVSILRSGGSQPITDQPVTIYFDQYQYPGCPAPASPILFLGINGSWAAHAMTGTRTCAPYGASGAARYSYTVPGKPEGTVVEYVVREGSSYYRAGTSPSYNEWNQGYSYYGTNNNFSYTVGKLASTVTIWPPNGSIRAGDSIWLNLDTRPAGTIIASEAVYSTNGTSWKVAPLIKDYPSQSPDHWYLNLGSFPARTELQVAFAMQDDAGRTHWNSKNGSNYRVTVNPAPALQWVGNTYHAPSSGITSNQDVWINSQSYPIGAAALAEVVFTVDGTTWQVRRMNLNSLYTSGNNDLWHLNLGKLPAGTRFRYAIHFKDSQGASRWDNNSGNDFHGLVGP